MQGATLPIVLYKINGLALNCKQLKVILILCQKNTH